MSALLQDVRYALRTCIKRPGFAAVAVTTLALGIGANTVIFTGVYWVLLQDLPYPQPDRLVVISQVTKRGMETGVSYPDFADWRTPNEAYAQMGATRTAAMTLATGDEAERVTGSFVSPEILPMLAGQALLGRTFTGEDYRSGSARTVVLAHGFWQRRLGGDAAAVGRRLTLDGEDYTVVGVMPPSFAYPFRAELWLPLESSENPEVLRDVTATPYEVLARLRPGVTLDRAARVAESLARRSWDGSAARQDEQIAKVERLRDTLPSIAKLRRALLVLQLAVSFVLLIACVNLANLLLARNADRRREFTIRLALGGSPSRLTRLLLVESGLLGLLGAVFGLVLAQWGLHVLRAVITWRPAGLMENGINAPVLLVTLSVALLTSLAFGLAPARLASRVNLSQPMKSDAGRATADAHGRRLGQSLVVVEVALAVMLLAAAGAMTRTLMDLASDDPGFDPAHAVCLALTTPSPSDTSQESLALYYEDALRRIQALPGVEAVGAVSFLPLTGYNPGVELAIEGRPTEAGAVVPRVDYQRITPDYFRAMRIPLLSGRWFGAADVKPGPETVIINDALARRFWPGEDALGKRIRLPDDRGATGILTVVGVVGNLRAFGPQGKSQPELYLPLYRPSMTLVIRTPGSPAQLVPAVRDVARGIGRNRAAFTLRTMPQMMTDLTERRRVFGWLLGGMATVGLTLTALGIYGVISHQTARRTGEMGVRLALGAHARDVFDLVIRQAMTLALGGILLGLAGAGAMMRILRSLPFGVSPADPLTLASVALVAGAVAWVAAYLPARRAAKVDPMVALRCE